MSSLMNGHSEKFFKNALEFKPERFLKSEDNDSGIENYIYYPFGIGPRNCIGQNFAQVSYFHYCIRNNKNSIQLFIKVS